MTTDDVKQSSNPLHEELLKAVEHFAHVLPAQATIRDFVHHNTLHGFEHLKFQDALKASNELTGAYGYWPQEKFRECYLKGRINDSDIHTVLEKDAELTADKKLFEVGGEENRRDVLCRDIYRIASLFPLKKITSCQLKWQADEAHAFESFQKDIPQNSREQLLALAKANGESIDQSTDKNEQEAIKNLWSACVEVLGLDPVLLHPEALTNLDTELSEKIGANLSEDEEQPDIELLLKKRSWDQVDKLLEKVGSDLTLRGFLKHLTGIDIQDEITPYLHPYLSSWLDEGFAQWHANPEQEKGFYQSWKASAVVDEAGLLNNIPDWKEHIDSLPNSAIDTVVAELQRIDIPKSKWGAYITRLALDLPGWSGMFYWRHDNPQYKTPLQQQQRQQKQTESEPVDIMDYLAVRLVLEHLYARKLCRKLWLVEASFTTIRGYLHRQYTEAYVRYTLYNQHLPEYLMNHSRQLVDEIAERDSLQMHLQIQQAHSSEWQLLAHMILTWQQSPSADSSLNATDKSHRGAFLHHDGWKLFRLAQHLGISASDVAKLDEIQLDTIFDCIEAMNKERSGFTLLQAYELHYRDVIFSAVTQNQGRGTWASRETDRPEAQIIFCMDDREEGFRRHLEHLNPRIETLGAAAFFGVVMNWKGLDDEESVVLCPVVVTPVHEVQEVADSAHSESAKKHQKRTKARSRLRDFIHQDSHRSLITTSLLTALYMPVTLAILLGKTFAPLGWNKLATGLKESFDTSSVTRITTTSPSVIEDRSPDNRQVGYLIEEQTNIVESFLQNNGLLKGLAPLIVMMGHYSRNQNNPHAAAYGCGACGGKFSGPNGRVFAAMANHPEVRVALAKRGLEIPEDTWFIGAEHDTCNENILWTDTDIIPTSLQTQFEKLKTDMDSVCQFSAHERCRKLASAPKQPTKDSASKHIAGRAVDFSQARPELGHATIAVGFVGRRYLSQGLFMDRRCFLISYDSNVDPEGAFLERILLSAGPVGAGINLEYYFSSVNNDKYGCGSKIVHNLSGLFGVMEGGSGDLRTGLPRQMIEIHEPMRLQLMVEASTDTLTEIYKRQPSIQELVGNGWLLLSAKDPDSAEIHTFNPDVGWELWEDNGETLPTVKNSQAWYQGHYDHLSPALIEASHV
ncbi:MAG: DUF2309 domain-containing protein [Methylophagaceae bacterium]